MTPFQPAVMLYFSHIIAPQATLFHCYGHLHVGIRYFSNAGRISNMPSKLAQSTAHFLKFPWYCHIVFSLPFLRVGFIFYRLLLTRRRTRRDAFMQRYLPVGLRMMKMMRLAKVTIFGILRKSV